MFGWCWQCGGRALSSVSCVKSLINSGPTTSYAAEWEPATESKRISGANETELIDDLQPPELCSIQFTCISK